MTEGQKAFAEELEDIVVEVLRKERHALVNSERMWIIEELKKRGLQNAKKGIREAKICVGEIQRCNENKGHAVNKNDVRLIRELQNLRFTVKYVETHRQWYDGDLKCEKCKKWSNWAGYVLWIEYFCGPKPDCYDTHDHYIVYF